ncbi:hypothetical protein HanRHA438_Chr17g0800811 [Helianthus annuus]|nr:hypothetical protein HanRHA438_Chr17g0800811 [Helianthus annuus]
MLQCGFTVPKKWSILNPFPKYFQVTTHMFCNKRRGIFRHVSSIEQQTMYLYKSKDDYTRILIKTITMNLLRQLLTVVRQL